MWTRASFRTGYGAPQGASKGMLRVNVVVKGSPEEAVGVQVGTVVVGRANRCSHCWVKVTRRQNSGTKGVGKPGEQGESDEEKQKGEVRQDMESKEWVSQQEWSTMRDKRTAEAQSVT